MWVLLVVGCELIIFLIYDLRFTIYVECWILHFSPFDSAQGDG